MSRGAPLVLLLAVAPALPQAPGARARDPAAPPAAEVTIDFVVRDTDGALVLDLTPDEVAVFEDGVLQEITLFRPATTGRGPQTASAGPAVPEDEPPSGTPPSSPETPSTSVVDREVFVALLFDRMGPEARRRAVDAVTRWVDLPAADGRQVGVYRIDERLELLQDFTDERAPVRGALDRVLAIPPTAHTPGQDRERLRTLRRELAGHGQWPSAGQPGGALLRPGLRQDGDTAEAEKERHLRAMELSMLQAMEALERDQQGLATTNALLSLLNGLRVLPGRKAVVWLSEGLVLPERVRGTLRNVIAEANRDGVSFHLADAGGRRVTSGAGEPLRLDDLATLVRETGGFFIAGTPDIAAGLGRVEEDLRAYSVLSYAPANARWDGGYRRTEIEVRRPGVRVQGRGGYYAVLTPTPTPILEHEAPVLAGLEAAPRADGIPLRASALHFPDTHGESVVALVADLPAAGPSLLPAEGEEGTYTQDFTVLGLVWDDSGRIVHKSSRRYVLSWDEANLPDVEVGRVLFEREGLLAPGRYTVAVVVHDAREGQMGVTRLPLDLPVIDDEQLRLSSLMIVGHAESNELGEPSPLLVEGTQLYPNLGDPVTRSAGQPLAFLFTLRPGARPLAEASVELLRDGTSVLQSPVVLPRPDATGQMQVVSGLQVGELEPGDYILRLSINNAQGFQARSAPFELVR